MIEIKGLYAGYGGRSVLNGIDMSFADSSLTVLLGPNGSGKSTLLKTVVGLNERSSGKILIDGIPTDSLTPRQRAIRMTYMAQNRSTPGIVARKMVLHGRFPYLSFPRRYRPEDMRIAQEALSLAGASSYADSLMTQLSEGQRQRVYLAMALVQDTQVILMDEPTNFLDISHQLYLMKLAEKLKAQGRCVVMVLHDIQLAMRYADRLYVMEDGSVRGSGNPEEVFRSGVIDRVFDIRLCRCMTENGPRYYCE